VTDHVITTKQHTSETKKTLLIAGIGVGVLLVGIGSGFFMGLQFGKIQANATPSSVSARSNGFSGTGNSSGGSSGAIRRGGVVGAVTAVSDTSITINAMSFGRQAATTSKTYAITSSTTITENGASVAATTIQNGDRVMIRTSTSDATTATSIVDDASSSDGASGRSTVPITSD
jgi:hypothetical protein